MPTPRFYFTDEPLTNTFWINNPVLIGQWHSELHLQVGSQVILFDGKSEDRLYKIIELEEAAAKLQLVTELVRHEAKADVHAFWLLGSPSQNQDFIQHATRLGIRNIIPIFTDSSQLKTFDINNARHFAAEATANSGQSDVPLIREPESLAQALGTYADKFTMYRCTAAQLAALDTTKAGKLGIVIEPEKGWPPAEQTALNEHKLLSIDEYHSSEPR